MTSNPSIPIFSSAMHKGAGLGADIYLIIYIGGVASALPSAGGVAWGRMASRVVCSYIKPQHSWEPIFTWSSSFVSYIKPQRVIELSGSHDGCISSVSYIKPQHMYVADKDIYVVYRPFPTSNHNLWKRDENILSVVYRPFPTSNHNYMHRMTDPLYVVYRPFPTSNHNCSAWLNQRPSVVYRPFPTSNHNYLLANPAAVKVVYRPFPTSNHNHGSANLRSSGLYIVRFLHQTTTRHLLVNIIISCISSVSYIKPQPFSLPARLQVSCISSVSYIKPQLFIKRILSCLVVYRPFPTSNHNKWLRSRYRNPLYIVRFLHQTTTTKIVVLWPLVLYIVRFLHQTTTDRYIY